MPELSSQEIFGHQTIHGYRDGHRLLETSVKLPSKTDQLMLTLSDLSGPAVPKGFEDYVTGYPLADFGYFVLAMSWYAEEMARPGCVWTHSILIDFSDVASLRDPVLLLELFNRPRGQAASLETYRERIPIPIGDTAKGTSSLVAQRLAGSLLEGIYHNPNVPIIIPSRTSREFGHVLLALWGQQWPRLRRAFTFCTGSLAARNLLGKAFDLQICPERRTLDLQNEMRNAVVVHRENGLEHKAWVKTATFDLRSTDRSLRSFLFDFGADVSGDRGDFVPLVEIYNSIADYNINQIDYNDLVKFVARRYPAAEEARKLKTELIGPKNVARRWLKRSVTAGDVVNAIYSSSPAAMLPRVADAGQLAADVWHGERAEAARIGRRILQGEYEPGVHFLETFIEAASIEDIDLLGESDLELAWEFARRNPRLAAARSLWLSPFEWHERLIRAIADCEALTRIEYHAIIEAMHRAGAWLGLEAIAKADGSRAVPVVLTILNTASLRGERMNWNEARAVLDELRAEIESWLENAEDDASRTSVGVAGLAVCAAGRARLNVGTLANVWEEFATGGDRTLPRALQECAASTLLAKALKTPTPDGGRVAAAVFWVVYSAVESNSLAYEQWRVFDGLLPDVRIWDMWDRCARLRAGLIQGFLRFDWPREHFLRATAQHELLRKFSSAYYSKRSFRRFLNQIEALASDDKAQ